MFAVKRYYCFAVPAALVMTFVVAFLLYGTNASPRLNSAISDKLFGHTTTPPPAPPASEFYDWKTHSAFGFPEHVDFESSSFDDLCRFFPTHLLNNDIQPILKTGHGVIDSRLAAQLKSVCACLGQQLLVFSDKAEIYQNHTLIDVIAEIPAELRNQVSDQFVGYNALYDPSIKAGPRAGWTIDKFKFLAYISATWRMRPDRRWYVFFEGDTYVIWDNVFRFLEHFDPDKPWYFGSPTPSRQNPKDPSKKISFANGGPGFILSREAMRRLVRDDWDQETGEYIGSMLIQRHWDDIVHDCCGDSILGWVLWQRDVELSGIWPMMNPHPPEGVPFEDRYWCQPVMTMHKPQIDLMETLWRWQWTARQPDRPLLYRDLALSYHQLDNQTVRTDWRNDEWGAIGLPDDSPGHQSADECALACQAHRDCFQWTFESGEGKSRCIGVNNFRMGRHTEPYLNDDKKRRKVVSGWNSPKIRDWIAQRPCDEVQWVRPSTTRIF